MSQLSAPQPVKANSSLPFLRGIVERRGNGFFIRPCFNVDYLQLEDSKGHLAALFQRYNPDPDLPVYVELHAKERSDLTWQLASVEAIGGGLESCEYELPGVDLRARGSSPDWVADIRGQRLQLNTDDSFVSLNFDLEADEKGGWQAQLGLPNQSYQLAMRLDRSACIDSAGNWFAQRMNLRLNQQSFSGCARRGDVANRTIGGIYSTDLNSEAAFVVAKLQPDGNFVLSIDQRSGQQLLVFEGIWHWKEPGLLALEVVDEGTTLLLRRSKDGYYRQEGFSEWFGEQGLKLKRAR